MSRESKTALILAVSGIIALMIGCIKSRDHSRSVRKVRSGISAQENNSQMDFSADRAGNLNSQTVATNERLNLKDYETMGKMIEIMKMQVESSSSDTLIGQLAKLNLKPAPTFSNGLSTGRITVVSTQASPDPNTRYFWAQFRSEDDGTGEYLQLMTFEFRPGPTALEDAQEMVKKVFSISRPPDFRAANLAAWNINDFYEVLVNTIGEEHLKAGDMDRRFTTDDLGVVQITVQARVDDDDDF